MNAFESAEDRKARIRRLNEVVKKWEPNPALTETTFNDLLAVVPLLAERIYHSLEARRIGGYPAIEYLDAQIDDDVAKMKARYAELRRDGFGVAHKTSTVEFIERAITEMLFTR